MLFFSLIIVVGIHLIAAKSYNFLKRKFSEMQKKKKKKKKI